MRVGDSETAAQKSKGGFFEDLSSATTHHVVCLDGAWA